MQTDGAAPATNELTNEDGERLRILLVEDDPQTLATTAEMLDLLGHFVAPASTAEVARARFLDGAFDVLITDIDLPGLSGVELAEEIVKKSSAPLGVIFATGKPRPAGSNALWLQKPYLVEELQAALAKAAAHAWRRSGQACDPA